MSELSPVNRERRLVVRAGLFVGGGMVLAAIVIFLIGKEGRLFDRRVVYRAAFENVEGLNIDSPVRLGGLGVGRVSMITFSPDLGDKRIQVQMQIAAKFKDRIRADSVARVGTRGVLGDKTVEISLGSAQAPPIEVGGEIPTGTSGDLTSLLKSGGEVLDNLLAISRDLRQGIAAYTHPELRADISGVVHNAREIFDEIRSGHGAMHALVYDPKTGQELTAFLAGAAGSARRLDKAMGHVEVLLSEVESGNGALHALFYDKKGGQAINELGAAAGELATLLRDSRQSPNGAVHQLVYGDARNLLADLGGAAADIKRITGKVSSGEGTLGALVNDPTVYEDLRTILGNVKRNRILRALVRFSISNGEKFDEVGTAEQQKK
jgi:phospholipid/cholesterol/gamma-HCH transport system substrate-binding protein